MFNIIFAIFSDIYIYLYVLNDKFLKMFDTFQKKYWNNTGNSLIEVNYKKNYEIYNYIIFLINIHYFFLHKKFIVPIRKYLII